MLETVLRIYIEERKYVFCCLYCRVCCKVFPYIVNQFVVVCVVEVDLVNA